MTDDPSLDAIEIGRLKAELKRAEHITKMVHRGRRFANEQWAQAGQDAFDGKPQNLRNRIELQGIQIVAMTKDATDGAPLIELDDKKLETIDVALAQSAAEIERLNGLLDMAQASFADGQWRQLKEMTAERDDTLAQTREACAKLCEIEAENHDRRANDDTYPSSDRIHYRLCAAIRRNCANEIRALSREIDNREEINIRERIAVMIEATFHDCKNVADAVRRFEI